MIWPLAKLDAFDQLRNQEIQIGVTLAMTMAHQIDRHAVDRSTKVCTVVQIEATQKHLVGLAGATMLCSDKSGDNLKNLTGPQAWSNIPIPLVRRCPETQKRQVHQDLSSGQLQQFLRHPVLVRHVRRLRLATTESTPRIAAISHSMVDGDTCPPTWPASTKLSYSLVKSSEYVLCRT